MTDSLDPLELPEPPEDVRVRTRDGRVIPVEVYFDGTDENGLSTWIATTPIPPWEIVGLTAKRIPGETTIAIGFEISDPGGA